MRICLLGWGTRGDVEPFVALGVGLQRAGHEVSVAASVDLSGLVSAAGLRFQPFLVDMSAEFEAEYGRRWVEGSHRPHREGLHLHRVMDAMAPAAAEGLERILGDCEAIISGMLTYEAALTASRHLGHKHIRGLMAPMTPTRHGPALLYPALGRRTSAANLWSSRLLEAALFQLVRPGGDVIRDRLDLPPGSYRHYLRMSRATPTLLGLSPVVVGQPDDWAGLVDVTGYWTQPVPEGYTPPPGLQAFLNQDPVPLYIGFGSMPSSQPERLWTMIAEALRRTGQRAVVRFCWRGWWPDQVPESMFIIEDAPFDWLFPRTAGVIHHGGAGTTGTALRAGVPQQVVAHMADQPYFGRRMHELGVAPVPLRLRELTTERLVGAITALTTQPRLRVQATALGEQVRQEDGVATAVAAIERIWS